MPCDGKNRNCQRRRELLEKLKCLITSMERKKPCEWDEKRVLPICFEPADNPVQSCNPLKNIKSYEFRLSHIIKCNCIKRNGVQDNCRITDCMGRPECMTKLFPICCPGQKALTKLTDFGDMNKAYDNFMKADEMRTDAIKHICKLKCTEQKCPSPSPLTCPPCPPPCPLPCPPPCPPKCSPYPPPCPPPCPSSCSVSCRPICLPLCMPKPSNTTQCMQVCFPPTCPPSNNSRKPKFCTPQCPLPALPCSSNMYVCSPMPVQKCPSCY